MASKHHSGQAGKGETVILFEKRFKPLILSGEKTRTYRFGKKRWNEGAVHQAKTDYSAGSCFAHLLITSVRNVAIADLTEEDAKADGFNSVTLLKFYLSHANPMPEFPYVWEVKFELVKEGDK